MDSTVASILVAVAAGAFVTALVVAAWMALRGAREEYADEEESPDRPFGGGDGDENGDGAWSDAPEATYSITWHVGESGAQGYVVVHRSDGRQVPKKQLPRESGAVVSEVIGVDGFAEAFQAESIDPGSPLLLRRLAETGAHPASVGIWDPETGRQVGYLSPDVSEWVERVSGGGEPLFCISLWEHWTTGERTRLQVLVLRKTASFNLPSTITPVASRPEGP